jgi:hypothetical protein
MKAPLRVPIVVRCVAAGACIAFAMPPWGWWPFAFVGLALWDRLIADVSWKRRFRRTWLVGAVWFFPTMLWMLDLTPPGYIAAWCPTPRTSASPWRSVPPGRIRWIAFPGAVVIATAPWTFPSAGAPREPRAHPGRQLRAATARRSTHLSRRPPASGPLLVVALVVVGASPSRPRGSAAGRRRPSPWPPSWA